MHHEKVASGNRCGFAGFDGSHRCQLAIPVATDCELGNAGHCDCLTKHDSDHGAVYLMQLEKSLTCGMIHDQKFLPLRVRKNSKAALKSWEEFVQKYFRMPADQQNLSIPEVGCKRSPTAIFRLLLIQRAPSANSLLPR